VNLFVSEFHKFNEMFSCVLLSFGMSICPGSMRYYYKEEFNATLLPGKWFYFSTTHPKERPLKFKIRSSKPVAIAVEDTKICPNETTIPLLVTEGGIQWYNVATDEKFSLNLVAVGLISGEQQIIDIDLGEEKQMTPRRRALLRIAATFVVMVITAFLIFWFCVLPGPKLKQD
jgi:hypothetical protein